jgi:hypothetical protein
MRDSAGQSSLGNFGALTIPERLTVLGAKPRLETASGLAGHCHPLNTAGSEGRGSASPWWSPRRSQPRDSRGRFVRGAVGGAPVGALSSKTAHRRRHFRQSACEGDPLRWLGGRVLQRGESTSPRESR